MTRAELDFLVRAWIFAKATNNTVHESELASILMEYL